MNAARLRLMPEARTAIARFVSPRWCFEPDGPRFSDRPAQGDPHRSAASYRMGPAKSTRAALAGASSAPAQGAGRPHSSSISSRIGIP